MGVSLLEAPVDSPGVVGYSAVTMAHCEVLEARGAELAGVLATAAAGLVEVLAEAIATQAWRGWGIRSVQHWAVVRFGLSSGRARRLVAAAEALVDLPECRAAFTAGEIGEDHVASVVRARVPAVHDATVAELARVGTVGQLQRALSFLPPPEPTDDADAPAAVTAAVSDERLATGFGDDGSWWISGRGDGDRGAVIDRALLAARDRLFRSRHDRDPEPGDLAAISGMDALEHLARVALDALDPATTAGRRPSERLIIDYHLHPDGAGSLHLGPALPAWLRDLVSCDADIRTWVHTADGSVDLGRRQRTVDARLRKVVEHRDGGCRIPGCGATRWLVIHHLCHWAAGGPTDTANLIALCAEHHRQIHRGELRVAGNPDTGALAITTPDGRPFGARPPRPPGSRPPATAATQAGLPPAAWTNRSGERADWRWLIWEDDRDRQDGG